METPFLRQRLKLLGPLNHSSDNKDYEGARIAPNCYMTCIVSLSRQSKTSGSLNRYMYVYNLHNTRSFTFSPYGCKYTLPSGVEINIPGTPFLCLIDTSRRDFFPTISLYRVSNMVSIQLTRKGTFSSSLNSVTFHYFTNDSKQKP